MFDEFNNYGSSQSPIVSEVSDDYGSKISEYPDSKHYVQMIERDTVGGLLNPVTRVSQSTILEQTYGYRKEDHDTQR